MVGICSNFPRTSEEYLYLASDKVSRLCAAGLAEHCSNKLSVRHIFTRVLQQQIPSRQGSWESAAVRDLQTRQTLAFFRGSLFGTSNGLRGLLARRSGANQSWGIAGDPSAYEGPSHTCWLPTTVYQRRSGRSAGDLTQSFVSSHCPW